MSRLPKTQENDIGLNYTPLLMRQAMAPDYMRKRCVHENPTGFDGAPTPIRPPGHSLPSNPQLLAFLKMPGNFQQTRPARSDNDDNNSYTSGEECFEHCHAQQEHQGGRNIDTDTDSNVSDTSRRQTYNRRNASSFNGNYEGDVSMFANQRNACSTKSFNRRCMRHLGHHQQQQQHQQHQQHQQQQQDIHHEHNQEGTDSDEDDGRNLSRVVITEMSMEQNPILVAIQRTANTLLTQNQQNQLKATLDWALQLFVLQFIVSFLSKLCILLTFAIFYLWKMTVFLKNVVGPMHVKNTIRFHIRRILWFVTLLKKNDTLLFGAVIICTPWLFFVSVIGFVLSLYYDIKKLVESTMQFIKSHLD